MTRAVSTPWAAPQPALPYFSLAPYPLLFSSFNAITANVLTLYTATQGGFRTVKPMCLVQGIAGTTLPHFTDTVLQWQTSPQDTDGMFSAAAPTQLSIQTSGWYRAVLQVHWDASNYTGQRACKIMLNGTDPNVLGVSLASSCGNAVGSGSEGHSLNCEALSYLVAGSSVFGNAWQVNTSTATLPLSSHYSGSFMSLEWLAP